MLKNWLEITRRWVKDALEIARSWVKELDMVTLKRELRNVDEADSLGTILLSSGLILGAILILVLWATRSAYL